MQHNENTKYAKGGHSWFDPWEEAEVSCEYRFAKPGKEDISRFNKSVGKDPSAAQQNLVVGAVHPEDKARLLADIETHGALLPSLSVWLLKVSGFSDLGN